jgi:hypothetical protein
MDIFTRFSRRALRALVLLALLLGAAPAGAASAQPDQRCFAETGQCIGGPIRAYWERNGGLPIFGYPVSPQQIETVEGQSLPVQWFERDRLEDHGPAGVMAGRLGARYLELTERPWQFFERAAGTPAGCRFFEPTGHTLCEPFLSYWLQGGGLERFGYPITQPTYEQIESRPYQVQYFERRRMEIHPELPGRPVLLGLLGSEVRATPEPLMAYPDCLGTLPERMRQTIAGLRLATPIGCPAGPAWTELPASTQQFERGSMIWLSERKNVLQWSYPPTILALSEPGPQVASYGDTWQAGQDPDTPAATPPRAGLYAPWRGFGKLWAEHPEVRDAIGWATEPKAQGHTVDTQLFSGGLLVRFNDTGLAYLFGNRNSPGPVLVIAP